MAAFIDEPGVKYRGVQVGDTLSIDGTRARAVRIDPNDHVLPFKLDSLGWVCAESVKRLETTTVEKELEPKPRHDVAVEFTPDELDLVATLLGKTGGGVKGDHAYNAYNKVSNVGGKVTGRYSFSTVGRGSIRIHDKQYDPAF